MYSNKLLDVIEKSRHVGQRYNASHVEDQLIEEMAELTQALIKFRRATGHGCHTPVSQQDAIDGVIEETADVIVCLSQLTGNFSNHQIRQVIEITGRKINRQLERIYKDGEN